MKKILIFTFSSIILLALIIKIFSFESDADNGYDEMSSVIGDVQNNNEQGNSKVKSSSDDESIVYSQTNRIVGVGTCFISYCGFNVTYNVETRQPDWVEYTLTAEQVLLTENTPKVPHCFMQDPNLSLPQASDEDYKGAHKLYGLSKGHMARHQDMKWSLQAVQESDYYTNICPQHEKLNTKLWKRIENRVREIATQYDSVHVICGPIFTDHSNGYIGPNRIPVPDYFFKTLLVKDDVGYHTIAFLCPNNNDSLTMKDAACTVDEVESMSQIDVYSYLPDKTESLIESQIDLKKWGL